MAEEREEEADALSSSPVQKARGFSSEQMVSCRECERANPPTRMNCLYCGAELPFDEANAALRRPSLRPLEEWEQGFNVVLLPVEASTGSSPAESQREAAELLRLEAADFVRIIEARRALPLARAASLEEAGLLEERLKKLGFKVSVVPDEVLEMGAPMPFRIRRLELSEDGLRAQAVGGETQAVGWRELRALVRGRLFTRRVELEERRTHLGMQSEMVDAREIAEDENVLDLFHDADAGQRHWRIEGDSFDYSCLGERKALLAAENFRTLVELLRARAPLAAYDEDYWRVRHLLAFIWPLAGRTESRGLRRERPGKFNVESSAVVSNEPQFTRYARLCFELRRRSLMSEEAAAQT
ncbi:MAG TPA: hypothetical protein VGB73_16660 [Pyrinomonadaceae bacterium]